jgi:hypothetical protein
MEARQALGEFLFLIIVGVIAGALGYKNKKYKKTAYYQITKNLFSDVKGDAGRYGEYLIYKRLQHLENEGGKFLFNIYVPKTYYETTEVDLLLICSKGLVVFESKNFSGWIFGNETHKSWTQTLPISRGQSHKERFYNPIMQNAAHIKHLEPFVGKNVPMWSVIVFSDECTLKDITVKSGNVRVINCYDVGSVIDEICGKVQTDYLTQMEIDDIYNRLYPHTQIGPEERERHAESVRR